MGSPGHRLRIAQSGGILSKELALLMAERFVQRRDIKAVQIALPDKVIYMPDREMKHLGVHEPLGFYGRHIVAHLEGAATYGHYLLDADDQCRMFCFDIDLKQNDDNFTGYYVPMIPYDEGSGMTEEQWDAQNQPIAFNPREDWLNRAHPSRAWLKSQMGMLARKLVSSIQKKLGLPCAAAYSGNKGIHVYGFTGPLPAMQVRAAAHYLIESTDDWELERGQHIYRYKLQDPFLGYPNFNLEVYPKQDSLGDKDLGNLIRLPLGKNLKNPADPTFFLDLTTPPGVMVPHKNPVRLLTNGNPYE